MSEYQYYEFQAVDRFLTSKEQKELRNISSRAQITSSRFFNEYHFGSFKGKPEDMVKKYYDGFLHFANWGTRELIFRFPLGTIDLPTLKKYQTKSSLRVTATRKDIIVRFYFQEEDSWELEEWYADGDGDLSDFLPLRASVLENFDYRVFYLGWLLGVQNNEVAINAQEPPLPQGLQGVLPDELRLFKRFFNISDELLEVAAQNSTSEIEDVCEDSYDVGISALSEGEKYDWLSQLLDGYDKHLSTRFRREIYEAAEIDIFCDVAPRKVSDITTLLKAA